MAMFHDKWHKNVTLPLGAAWGNGLGGVAACMVWTASDSSKNPLGKSKVNATRQGYRPKATPTVTYEPHSQSESIEVSRQTGSLRAKYVPTPPPAPKVCDEPTITHRVVTVHEEPDSELEVNGVTARSSGSRMSTYRDDTYRQGYMTPHPPTRKQADDIIREDVAKEAVNAHVRKSGGRSVSVPPAHVVHRHGPRCTCTKKEAWGGRESTRVNQSRADYYDRQRHLSQAEERRLVANGYETPNHTYDDNSRDIYGYGPISRPASALHSKKYRNVHFGTTTKRPNTVGGAYVDYPRDQYGVTWADDTRDHVRSSALYRHPEHFNDWRHRTTSLAKDVYVTPEGRVLRICEPQDERSRPGSEPWRMNKYRSVKPKVSTRWAEDPYRKSGDSPNKVNLQMECPDDSDMVVNVRVRSANQSETVY